METTRISLAASEAGATYQRSLNAGNYQFRYRVGDSAGVRYENLEAVIIAGEQTITAHFGLGARELGFTQIPSGDKHVPAIRSDRTLWAWGTDTFGCLGVPGLADNLSPVQVLAAGSHGAIAAGYSFVLGIDQNGMLWGWGGNNRYQLGVQIIKEPTQIGFSLY